ncbi:unnamed protein product [Calypogeia fissa]
MEPAVDMDFPSDEEHLAISRALWDLEDDVALSSSLVRDYTSVSPPSSVPSFRELRFQPSNLWIAWSSLSSAPSQPAAGENHFPAAEFHSSFIISQVLSSFSPGLVWLPRSSFSSAPLLCS